MDGPGDAVGNLLNEIDKKVSKADKATMEDAIAGIDDSKWMTPAMVEKAKEQPGNIILSLKNLAKERGYAPTNGGYVHANLLEGIEKSTWIDSNLVETGKEQPLRICEVASIKEAPDFHITPDAHWIYWNKDNSIYKQSADLSTPPFVYASVGKNAVITNLWLEGATPCYLSDAGDVYVGDHKLDADSLADARNRECRVCVKSGKICVIVVSTSGVYTYVWSKSWTVVVAGDYYGGWIRSSNTVFVDQAHTTSSVESSIVTNLQPMGHEFHNGLYKNMGGHDILFSVHTYYENTKWECQGIIGLDSNGEPISYLNMSNLRTAPQHYITGFYVRSNNVIVWFYTITDVQTRYFKCATGTVFSFGTTSEPSNQTLVSLYKPSSYPGAVFTASFAITYGTYTRIFGWFSTLNFNDTQDTEITFDMSSPCCYSFYTSLSLSDDRGDLGTSTSLSIAASTSLYNIMNTAGGQMRNLPYSGTLFPFRTIAYTDTASPLKRWIFFCTLYNSQFVSSMDKNGNCYVATAIYNSSASSCSDMKAFCPLVNVRSETEYGRQSMIYLYNSSLKTYTNIYQTLGTSGYLYYESILGSDSPPVVKLPDIDCGYVVL